MSPGGDTGAGRIEGRKLMGRLGASNRHSTGFR
jgi:hypothetical protein